MQPPHHLNVVVQAQPLCCQLQGVGSIAQPSFCVGSQWCCKPSMLSSYQHTADMRTTCLTWLCVYRVT